MKVLLQRVKNARVEVDGAITGQINQGLLLLIGVEKHDSPELIDRITDKVLAYRVFSDADGKMNLSVKDIQGGVLAVSQFTLAADTRKGLRPGFSAAASPEQAQQLFQYCVDQLRLKHPLVETGIFGADMQVHLVNDGPVTFMLEI